MLGLDIDGVTINSYSGITQKVQTRTNVYIPLNELHDFEFKYPDLYDDDAFFEIFNDIILNDPGCQNPYWGVGKAIEKFYLSEYNESKPIYFLTARHKKYYNQTKSWLHNNLPQTVKFKLICCGSSDNKIKYLEKHKIEIFVEDNHHFINKLQSIKNLELPKSLLYCYLVNREWNKNHKISLGIHNWIEYKRVNSLPDAINDLLNKNT